MATISQLPAQLNFNSVAGNPATLVYNFTLTDSNGNPITWSHVTGYQVDITDQYGNTIQGVTPTITSPVAYQLVFGWTPAQTQLLGNAQTPRMAVSIFLDNAGPYAVTAGVLAMSPPEYPATS